MKDQRLERLSDLVRMGTPIGFIEALEVMEYQGKLKEQRDITKRCTLTGKAVSFFNKLKLLVGFPGK